MFMTISDAVQRLVNIMVNNDKKVVADFLIEKRRLAELRGKFGRKGMVGGSSSAPANSPIVIGSQSEVKISSTDPELANIQKVAGDINKSRPERQQAFDDIKTIKEAGWTKYKNGKTIKETIDELIKNGANKITISRPRFYIEGGGNKWGLSTKLERDYADYKINRANKYSTQLSINSKIELRGAYGRKGMIGGSSKNPTYSPTVKATIAKVPLEVVDKISANSEKKFLKGRISKVEIIEALKNSGAGRIEATLFKARSSDPSLWFKSSMNTHIDKFGQTVSDYTLIFEFFEDGHVSAYIPYSWESGHNGGWLNKEGYPVAAKVITSTLVGKGFTYISMLDKEGKDARFKL